MSLLTRCPACETLFKLVPDQLRISQGWVKCGQCSEIFDASKHLIQVAVEPEATVESPLIVAQPDGGTEMSSAPEAQPTIGAEMEPEVVAATEPEPAADAMCCPVSAGAGQQTPEVLVPCAVEVADTEGQKAPMAIEHLTDVTPMREQPLSPEGVQELPTVSFLGGSQRHSVWQSRGGKIVLWLAVFLLVAGLSLQWLYWERDRLAATYPGQKPRLQQMCRLLNCSIQALQRIDAIAIDSAAFSRLGPDSYRLSFVFKNLSSLELALPSIELTLTDTQEQVIVRKALLPKELLLVTPALLPGVELPVSLALGVDLGDAAPHVMGYRFLAFYP